MTQTTQRVTITEDNQVATVTLSRPDKRNALDLEMIQAIVAAGEALAERKDIRAVVLAGEGDAFCAGLDLAAMPKIAQVAMQGGGIMERSHGVSNLFQAVAMVWAELPQPVIAAVQGHALGGGFQLMLGADLRIAAPSTRFSIMEGRWGLVPDMGGLVLMRRLARGDVIRKLTYTAEIFETDAAERYGFVTEISEDPLARAQELAGTIGAQSPDAVRTAKKLISDTETTSWLDTLLAESKAQEGLIGQPNQMEAVMAGMQKRAAKFRD
ncbi:crotonase/enoyl-CoA hydratase family protein [Aliiroseovarius sp. KMU-50]|uniref:Crotonase/enoyl-CoA hydratase family protein n=1 Tax=Aliiroseovarius salicola TaxID=3009082 RepID=A0ABT4W0I6_9RHOB|nr:crotonase/enoyl-CoA hydratase family protein [Aliiroseovarius sp. KMU-50]MDA5094010.1 crotonase/enoyl-CoA hydratase family protein [Aliiroseovarius sp. KMU-50]